MMDASEHILFAAVGDVHANMHMMIDLIQAWETRMSARVSFVLQAGDFEPHRHEADLHTMAAPSKHKRVGDFPDFAAGRPVLPWPVYFIGGNHEPYGFLDQFPHGAEIAHNLYYLGRAEVNTIAKLRVVSLSGIFREKDYSSPRPPVERMNKIPNKTFTSFREADITRIISFECADILLLHDWPANILRQEDLIRFNEQGRRLDYERLGNPYLRGLIDLLSPQLVLCGHVHMRYTSQLDTLDGSAAHIHCLAKVSQGKDGFAVFKACKD